MALTLVKIKKTGRFQVVDSISGDLVGYGRAHKSLTCPTMVTLTFSSSVLDQLSGPNPHYAIRVPIDWTKEITYDA